jgi:hypothetical protein
LGDVVFEICGHSFEPANSHRLLFYPTSPAGWLARSVAGSTQNSRKNIRLPVDHIGLCIFASGNKSDVMRYWRVSRTCILTINYLVVILRIFDIGGLHTPLFYNIISIIYLKSSNIVKYKLLVFLRKEKDFIIIGQNQKKLQFRLVINRKCHF